MDKHEVVLTIGDSPVNRRDHVAIYGVDGAYTPLWKGACRKWFGTDKIGTKIKVTVEEVEPTWPVVRWGDDNLAFYCGRCGWGGLSVGHSECPHCTANLKGEVPQSKVADFLREEG